MNYRKRDTTIYIQVKDVNLGIVFRNVYCLCFTNSLLLSWGIIIL